MNTKILIVDDDTDILEILTMVLSEVGYEVNAVDNGEDIFGTVKSFNPNLILLDVMLGSMDGRVICKNLKNNPETERLPVILTSGSHDLSKSLYLPGAPDDFIAKPFDIQNLLNKIASQFN